MIHLNLHIDSLLQPRHGLSVEIFLIMDDPISPLLQMELLSLLLEAIE